MSEAAQEMRALSRHMFLSALAESSVEKAFERHVEINRRLLRICEDQYDLNSFARILVVVMGKAACPMARALKAQLGSKAAGILASPQGPPSEQPPMPEGFRHFPGGHPLPNA